MHDFERIVEDMNARRTRTRPPKEYPLRYRCGECESYACRHEVVSFNPLPKLITSQMQGSKRRVP